MRRSATVVAVLVLLCGAARLAMGQASARFEFHSNPWINLHHFLYQWARADLGLGTGRQHVPVAERSSLESLTGLERRTWLEALRFYRDSVAARGHFDPAMLHQKRSLAKLAGDAPTPTSDAIAGIGAALAAAMPVYRSRWWPAHDRANHDWIAGVLPRLRRYEARYVELTRRTHGARWPSGRRRVDVSAYANARAGYTAQGEITIYSTDPGNQDLYALETLLHEVQHTREIGSAGREGLSRAFERAGIEEPENLWHGLIFETAGTFLQTVADEEGLPQHVPYWIREGFRELGGWSDVVRAAEADWLPVLHGRASRERGFEALVDRFRGASGGADSSRVRG